MHPDNVDLYNWMVSLLLVTLFGYPRQEFVSNFIPDALFQDLFAHHLGAMVGEGQLGYLSLDSPQLKVQDYPSKHHSALQHDISYWQLLCGIFDSFESFACQAN